ncbi:Ethylene-responsive transcription factor 9 [Hordeum vulgare]|nr:AP2-like ethylene-responsive transcription factor BBM1 [Hordeum vulgare subsp. vulgare]KAE8767868.1 Ethylene-responsive transcription factor 9 [Hordeum vulgare]
MAVERDEDVASATANRKKRAASRPVPNAGEATACPGSSPRFRGVHLRCPGKYTVQQQFAGEAARPYDAAAIRLHGAAAMTNFEQHPATAATRRRPGLFGVHGTPSGEHKAQIWTRTAAEEADEVAAIGLHGAAAAFTDPDRHGDDGGAPPPRVSCEGEAPGDAAKNKKGRAAPRSGFRGVYRHPRSGRYSAQIRDPERRAKLYWLGSFATGEEAARAHDAAAVTLYGSKAVTNYEQPRTAAIDGEESPMDHFPELRSNIRAWRKEVAASGTRSGHVGVHRYRGKYSAQIWDPVRRADQWLRTFGAAEDIFGAYDSAAVRMHGAAAETNFKQPRSAAAADDGEVSAMNLNEFVEPPALGFFPDSITPDGQLDDLLTGLPPVELQQVDELLEEMGFTNMVA